MKSLSRKASISLIALLTFTTLSLGIYSLIISRRASHLQTVAESFNQRAVNELCESIDSIATNLQKCLYTASRQTLAKQGNRLCREAAAAKESLASLNSEDSDAKEIYKFLSQVGNYTLAIAEKDEKSIGKEDQKSLQKLYNYSKALSDSLTEILEDYSDGIVRFDVADSQKTKAASDLPDDFYSRMNDTAQTITDYPVLLYDGPFSDLQGNGEYSMLKNKHEITENEAAEISAKLLGADAASLRREDSINAEPELFSFSLGESYVSVTKKGGYIASFMSNPRTGSASLSPREAITRAAKFLGELGYKSMKESYYTVYDGICTINFAYRQKGVVCYGDLIKISIALDTGKITALEAGSYLANHKQRSFPAKTLTKAAAAKKLSSALEVISCQKALIPDGYGNETICYEFHCRGYGDSEVLVYIDCVTGNEHDIMLLLYEDGGILTK